MFVRLPGRRIAALFVCFNVIFLAYIYIVRQPSLDISSHPYFFYDLDAQEPRKPDQKCILPRMHPFHPSIWAYLKFPKEISCKTRQLELIYIDLEGKIIFNQTEIKAAGYRPQENLFCQWSPVFRDGDDKVYYGKQISIPEDGYQLQINNSFIRVQCQNYARFSIYEKIHGHIQTEKTAESPKHLINVLIFGLDSMSRLAFIRHLPRTYRYLTEELNMTVLRGMNKVGDNTFPNLIPLLTGYKAYDKRLGSVTDYFDHWPLLWKNFSDVGYGTLWAEDFIRFGLFNYLAKGFRQPPTHHYMRPYWLAIEESRLLHQSSYHCYGSQPKYFVQMDFVRRFVSAYEKAKRAYFGFSFLAELSHEYTTRISSADVHLERFFTWLKEESYLENTVLFVMSDHGHRFDSIRTTEVGHNEERLPFHAIYIPQSMTVLYPTARETLALNSGRLVTPYDTYATLVDILHLATEGRPLGHSEHFLGQSLFREVPLNRTCSDASIPFEYCTCQTDTAIPVTDIRAQKAADTIISTIDMLLKEGGVGKICLSRKLSSIKTAHLVHTEGTHTAKEDVKVRVMIKTDPSGMFEALVSLQNGAEKVVGDISRLSPYQSQSSCIQHSILRKYCYCYLHLT